MCKCGGHVKDLRRAVPAVWKRRCIALSSEIREMESRRRGAPLGSPVRQGGPIVGGRWRSTRWGGGVA
ncbi:hypothetical protein WJX77_002614 [Trebouxia sp. C0004]